MVTRLEFFMLRAEAVGQFRVHGLTDIAVIKEILGRTADNAELVSRLPEWLRGLK